MKVIVVGGGASGMMAALTAAENPSNHVILLERQNRVGRKLLATGNGRCNLSNVHVSPEHYHGQQPSFVEHALSAFTVSDTLHYFRSLGLMTTVEESGKVYPFSDQANSVVDVLRFALNAKGVQVVCGCEITAISKKARGYSVKSADANHFADKLIVACGGCAGSKLGGTDLGYQLLTSLGHRLIQPKPALVQIKTDISHTRGLKGVRADAGVTLKRNGRTVAQDAGEIQFTDFGISGPTIFSLSREAAAGGDQVLLLDLLRPLSEEDTTEFLRMKQANISGLLLEDFLTGLLHNRLGRVVLNSLNYSLEQPVSNLTEKDIQAIARRIKYFPMTVTGVMGLDQAQVTAGGIATADFRADTLESRICPGLFVTGELLDIDGDCGGFNLQWAWSSGRVAGRLGKTGEQA